MLYCQKAVWLLKSEIELLKLIFSRKQESISYNSEPTKSKVYFIPKPDGLGIIGMGEIAISLQLTGEFFDERGNPSTLSHISKAMEQTFNFSCGSIYKTKTRIFGRKSYNLTKALDYLKNLIIHENRKKNKK